MTNNPDTPLHEADEYLFFTPRRLLVIALYSCFFASLAAFWFASNLFGLAGYFLPPPLLQEVLALRFVLLLLPLIGMLICYIFLRNITGDIMACPERYLDERQKMVRDQAHRGAYNIIKVACILAAIGFLLHSTLGTLPTKTPSLRVTAPPIKRGTITGFDASGKVENTTTVVIWAVRTEQGDVTPLVTQFIAQPPDQGKQSPNNDVLKAQAAMQQKLAMQKKVFAARQIAIRDKEPIIFPSDPTSITALYGALLLSLFLMITALPMSLVAWKERF